MSAPVMAGTPGPVGPGGLLRADVLGTVSWRTPITLAVISVAALFAFVLFTPQTAIAQFAFTEPDASWQWPVWHAPAQLVLIICAVGTFALTAAAFAAAAARKPRRWYLVAFGALVLVMFLVWVMSASTGTLRLPFLLGLTMTWAVPLVFGAFAGVLCERAGVINIAIEGQLLAGAFLCAIAGSITGSAYVGLVAAPIAGALVGLILAVFSITYKVDQIIVGVVVNVLVLGLTNYLFSTVLSENPQEFNSPPPLPTWRIPGLADIPVIGDALFNQTVIVYAMYVAVFVLQYMLFRSRWGLRLRSVGEHPKAADTVGIKVNRTRYRAVVLGSAVAGFGGASFLAAGLAFTKEVSAGRGYIALAAMILGRWSPKGALAAAVLFGFTDALNRVLRNIGSPVDYELMSMLPYLATIFAVAGLVGRVRPPAADGKPYP